MASRYGAREPGTDGSDFRYREQVASKHTTSLAVKGRLKRYFFLNIILSVVQLILLVVTALDLVEDATKLQPAPWQAIWMLSGIPSITGLAALPKNRSGLLKIHNAGLIVFGVGGIVWGVVSNYENMVNLWEGNPTEEIFGLPKVLIVYNSAVVAFALYMSTIFNTRTLSSVWDYRKTR